MMEQVGGQWKRLVGDDRGGYEMEDEGNAMVNEMLEGPVSSGLSPSLALCSISRHTIRPFYQVHPSDACVYTWSTQLHIRLHFVPCIPLQNIERLKGTLADLDHAGADNEKTIFVDEEEAAQQILKRGTKRKLGVETTVPEIERDPSVELKLRKTKARQYKELQVCVVDIGCLASGPLPTISSPRLDARVHASHPDNGPVGTTTTTAALPHLFD